MENTLTITVSIRNNEGEIIAISESERPIPDIEEIEEQGFRASFHDMETAMLESRKEVTESALSSYLEALSLKKNKGRIINRGPNQGGTLWNRERAWPNNNECPQNNEPEWSPHILS